MVRGDIPKNFGIQGADKKQKQQMLKDFKKIQKAVKFEEAYLRPFATEIKKVIDIPLILPGGLRTVKVMEDVLEKGDADFIGLCRPLIRDPYFPVRAQRGGIKKSDCLNCNWCLRHPVMCYQKQFRPPTI
jgi:2,4-dienoyl-CoA reductase-like NADH-dependent reductase (Old Yellow Enzyme family)